MLYKCAPCPIPMLVRYRYAYMRTPRKKERKNVTRCGGLPSQKMSSARKRTERGQLGDRRGCGRKFVQLSVPCPLERGGGFHLRSPVFEDKSACSVAGWHSSTTNPGRLDRTRELAPRVIECLGVLTRRYGDGRDPRRGRRAVMGLGRVMRTSLGRSRDSQSRRQS